MPNYQDTEIAIVGAGPAGLAVAAALQTRGLEFMLLDRSANVGGLWNLRTPGSPCHPSVQAVTPTAMMAFPGVPMESENGFSAQRHVLNHLAAFAVENKLSNVTRFYVTRADRRSSNWVLTSSEGDRITCRHLVLCTGLFWAPKWSRGDSSNDSKVVHASMISETTINPKSAVRIVGGGNSAVDAARLVLASSGFVCFRWRSAPWVVPLSSNWPKLCAARQSSSVLEGRLFQQRAMYAAATNVARIHKISGLTPRGLPLKNSTMTGERIFEVLSSPRTHVWRRGCCAPELTIMATGYLGFTSPLGSLSDLGLEYPFVQSARFKNLYSASHFLTERAGFPFFLVLAENIANRITEKRNASSGGARESILQGIRLPTGDWVRAFSPALTRVLDSS